MKGFPKFYDVDGALVKIDYDPKTDEVFGMTSLGKPYPPMKATSEGESITEKQFNKASKNHSNPSSSAASL